MQKIYANLLKGCYPNILRTVKTENNPISKNSSDIYIDTSQKKVHNGLAGIRNAIGYEAVTHNNYETASCMHLSGEIQSADTIKCWQEHAAKETH